MMPLIVSPALRIALSAAAMMGTLALPAPAAAQDELGEARLRKIEAEIRALQRKVFPGGDGRYFEPQIAPDAPAPAQRQTGPSTTAVTDILARIDAIENQLQRLTARSEEMGNALAGLEERLDVLEAQGGLTDEAPALPLEDTLPATDSNLAAMGARGAEEQPAAASASASASAPAPAPAPAQAQGGAPDPAPSPERLAAVQEIAMPQTGDAADDEYVYGFRLWDAGFYPEARQQLAKFVEQHPDHWRATYGRNLLGRAYLDDGMAEDAARWFLRNYQTDRTAVRAPDSLLYLAESMIALGDTRRACIALAEFGETYPAIASGRLMDQYENNRRRVTCE